MKRLRLTRPVAVPNAIERDGELVTVTDADARLLLGGDFRLGAAAELIEDLGPDPTPPGTVEVEVLLPVLLCGRGCAPGERVWISKADAARLYGSPRVRFVSETQPAVEDGAQVIAAAAASRPGPLVRVNSKGVGR